MKVKQFKPYHFSSITFPVQQYFFKHNMQTLNTNYTNTYTVTNLSIQMTFQKTIIQWFM